MVKRFERVLPRSLAKPLNPKGLALGSVYFQGNLFVKFFPDFTRLRRPSRLNRQSNTKKCPICQLDAEQGCRLTLLNLSENDIKKL
jgi:hypothetical protein